MRRSRWFLALLTGLFAAQSILGGVAVASADSEATCEAMAERHRNMQLGTLAESTASSSAQAPQQRSCDMPADYASCPSQASCATLANGQLEIVVDPDRPASMPAGEALMPRLWSTPPELRPPRA